MGIFDGFRTAKKTTAMDRAERLAAQKDEGVEPLLVVLIEEVRQLRRDLADERDRRLDAERGRERRPDRR